MARYLRIAAAVVFALLAVGFVALWVRSYWQADVISGPIGPARYAGIGPHKGTLYCSVAVLGFNVPQLETWRLRNRPFLLPTESSFLGTYLGFALHTGPSLYSIGLPFWFLFTSLGLAALFAVKQTWRFSLRSVLVVTTILAAILDVAVYAVRS